MTHKEIKKDITNKLEASLKELRASLGEKKFNNRIKKAAKILAEGIGKEAKQEASPAIAKVVVKTNSTATKKAPVKKATKAVVKKAGHPVTPKATKAPVAKKKVVVKAK